MICQTIDGLWDFARELGTTSALQLLYQSALNRRNDADRLRAIYLETRSFSDVTRRSAEIWEDGSLEDPRA